MLANKYVLAHRVSFNDKSREVRKHDSPCSPRSKASINGPGSTAYLIKSDSVKAGNSGRVCFFCKKPGHVIADCHVLSKKQKAPKPVALLASVPHLLSGGDVFNQLTKDRQVEPDLFAPFRMEGSIAASKSGKFVPVRILRDTAAAQSLLVEGVLPLSGETFTGEHALVRGCGMTWLKAPLHVVHLKSGLVTGPVQGLFALNFQVEGGDDPGQ